jgi:hypothetical protein
LFHAFNLFSMNLPLTRDPKMVDASIDKCARAIVNVPKAMLLLLFLILCYRKSVRNIFFMKLFFEE